MAKTNRPEQGNPLANMGLDEIVRGITSESTPNQTAEPAEKTEPAKPERSRRGKAKLFEESLEKYTRISEQGVAVWLPKEVKKRLELVRLNASKNIPLRALASAIIMTYIAENEKIINDL